MKNKYANAHMRTAYNYAELSYCKRKQVGCIIVKDDRIISIGYNGSPPGWTNQCENEKGLTKPEIYHAEANAIAKLARSHESGDSASVFVTCAPCIDCAKLLAQTGVKEVYFAEHYKGTCGLDFLNKCGIKTIEMVVSDDNLPSFKIKPSVFEIIKGAIREFFCRR
jgi:dCMP deaminase